MQGKTWYSILGVDAMPLSLKNLLLSKSSLIYFVKIQKKYSVFIHRDALGQIMEIFLLRGIHHPQEQEGMNQRIR